MLNPIIIKIGFIQITWYSLIYVLCALTLLLILTKSKNSPLTKNQSYDFTILLIFSILIGARIFHVLFWDFSCFKTNPIEILKIYKGGMSFHGGLIGATLVTYFYTKKHKINFLKLTDTITLPILFFTIFGRIANFLNHEILGKVASRFCVTFQGDFCRHPVQLYAATGRLILFAILLQIKKQKPKDGVLTFTFITLLGIGRFFLDFLREDTLYFHFSVGQWFSSAMIILGIYFLKNKITFSSRS